MERGLKDYKGEIYFTSGEDDEIGASQVCEYLYKASESAKKRVIEIIPNCDHQFKGKRNGKILSNAYLWAFGDKSNFPGPWGGIALYK